MFEPCAKFCVGAVFYYADIRSVRVVVDVCKDITYCNFLWPLTDFKGKVIWNKEHLEQYLSVLVRFLIFESKDVILYFT